MSDSVTVKLKGDKADLDGALASAQSSILSWGGTIKGAMVGLVGVFAAKQLFSFGTDLMAAAGEAEASQQKLQSVLKATGHAAGFTQEQLNQMGADMHELTGIGDDTITEMQAVQATFKNIRGDVFQEATLAAADMAAVMGGDLVGATEMVSKALNDPAKGIAALTRNGVTFSESQKEMIATLQDSGDMLGAQKIILDELASEFGGAAADQLDTFNGRVNLLWDSLGELGESVGGMLIPAFEALIPVGEFVIGFFQDFIDILGESQEQTVEYSDSWTNMFIDGFISGVKTLGDGFSWMEFLFNNWGNIVERQTYAVMNALVATFEEMKHQFTVVAPAYMTWFAENWKAILSDMSRLSVIIFQNMFANVVEFVRGVAAYFTEGEANFRFVALETGFTKTMADLPNIARRELSSTEKYLLESIDQMDQMIGQDLNNIFEKNRNFLDKVFEVKNEEKPRVDLTADTKPFEASVASAKKKAEKEVKVAVDKDDSKLQAKEAKEAKADAILGQTSGLEDLNKSIQAAAFKSAKDNVSMPQAMPQFGGEVFMAVKGPERHAPEKKKEHEKSLDEKKKKEDAEKAEKHKLLMSAAMEDRKYWSEQNPDYVPNPFVGDNTKMNGFEEDPVTAPKAKGSTGKEVNVIDPANAESASTLKQLKDIMLAQHPETIKALKMAGGLA